MSVSCITLYFVFVRVSCVFCPSAVHLSLSRAACGGGFVLAGFLRVRPVVFVLF